MTIPTGQNISTITEMRENTLKLLQNVQKKSEPTVIMHRNSPRAILLSVKRYNQLMDLLEDYLDGQLAIQLEKELENSSPEDFIPLEKLHQELGINV